MCRLQAAAFLAGVVKQAIEKIDRLRGVAGQTLVSAVTRRRGW